MKIPAIQIYNSNQFYKPLSSNKTEITTTDNRNFVSIYNTSGLSFGIANSGKLKTLFTYGLPCMYTGIDMIDPKRVQKIVKSGQFRGSSEKALAAMKPFENMITDVEKKVYKIIKTQSELSPELNFKEILDKVAPTYKKSLRKKQAVIFKELLENAKELPENYSNNFNLLMQETNNKLKDKPIWTPFSSFEFKYKLNKINDDVKKRGGFKDQRVMKKMLLEAERLTDDTTVQTEEHQKNIMNFLGIILKTSVLKDDEQLNTLIETSKSRLNHEKVKTPFSRKSFIYDLTKLLSDLPDQDLATKLVTTATKLPTSRESTSAYILKFSTESPEKIAYRLLWPTFASVEHILPKSCGGADAMSNFGGATTRVNAERGNIPFDVQIKKMPKTKKNSQKYVDRLIELANNGTFDKNKIDKKYIEDFKNTVQKQSKGEIVLNTKDLIK